MLISASAHAHPHADRKPGFKLQFKLRHWPHGTLIVAFRSAKGTTTLRRAKVDERRRARRPSVLSLVAPIALTPAGPLQSQSVAGLPAGSM